MLFSRPNGDIEGNLKRLSKLPPFTLVDRLKKVLDLDNQSYDMIDKERFSNQIVEFQFFAKKVIPQLKTFKKVLEAYRDNKRYVVNDNNAFAKLLDKYEECNLSNYTEGKANKMVLNGENGQRDLLDQMVHMAQNLKNPFEDMYHWCKGEIYDLQGIQTACEARDLIEKDLKKQEKSKTNTQKDLENVTTGKTTIRTIFKSQNDTGGMVNKIENTEKNIDSLIILHELATIYIGDKVVPVIKKDKMNTYRRMMQQFSIIEINNAHQTANCWSKILASPNIKGVAQQMSTDAP